MGVAVRIAAISAFCCLVACAPAGGEDTGGGGTKTEKKELPLSASVGEVEADGTSTIVFTLTGDATAAVELSATKGTWEESEGPRLSLSSAVGTATLVTCDSRSDATCSGTVTVRATGSDDSVGTVQVKFVGLEQCSNGVDDNGDGAMDCADPKCLDALCPTPKNAVGDFKCSSALTCACAAGTVEICNDGIDNNCDGKADCLDSTCASKGCNLGGGFVGVCKSSVCTCEQTTETTCNDGKDNDCDGVADCADPNCRPVGNNLGKVCDANGNTCSPVINNVSSCTVCSGNGGSAQTGAEYTCGDNFDNDCDGIIDCQDDDCGGRSCNASGKTCNGDMGSATFKQCICSGPEAQGETTCNDGLDNDCDGKIDCKDTDCQPSGSSAGRTCGPNGKVCNTTSGGTCGCSGGGGTAEATEASCGDGFDNDCDGMTDCVDLNCRPATVNGTGKSCDTVSPLTSGRTCDFGGQCICSAGQAPERTCGDGLDNDCDGLTDCGDPDCATLSCSVTGRFCSGGSCACPSGQASETTGQCGDNLDNDCDGTTDCADGDCNNQACSPGNPTYQCLTSVCKDPTASFSLVLTATKTRIPANGVATTVITGTLKNSSGTPVPSATVSFSTTHGVFSNGLSTITPAQTDANGRTSVTLTSAAGGGLATVTGTYNAVNGTVAIDMPLMGQVKFISQQYSVIGARYSAFQEKSLLTFQVLDASNNPYPADLTVNFSHSQVGDSYIGTVPSCASSTCTASAVTDANGKVTVLLNSGTVASVVSVNASSTAGGVVGNSSASNLAIIGAKASGKHISVNCTPYNIPAFYNDDCTNSFVNETIDCTAALADRFQNVLGVATLVTLNTEAGAAGPPATTPAYDPTKAPTTQMNLGQAKNFISVYGFALPKDVAPNADEYSHTANVGCGVKTQNPRDGLVSVLVSAAGEEGFVDGSNGFPSNGVYDLGEDFIDIAEPFVDENDNGTRDNSEPYVDSNNNGQWNAPNGVWDQSTVIWAETRVLYSGTPATLSTANGEGLSRFWDPAVQPEPGNGPTFEPSFVVHPGSPAGTSKAMWLKFMDKNLNSPAVDASYALAVTSPASAKTKAVYTTSPWDLDRLGMSFTQQFCDSNKMNCAASCQHAPCYPTTRVGDYEYGSTGVVTITGGSDPEPSVTVRAAATLFGVTRYIYTTGACVPP